ncbi:MAG TPA: 3-phosphoserine/phosphohydroxythreonine transaminase [Deltaproteobacteria bacterium]|nr:3-phosphoserine/phosphohydroxythreonine transaminase [Deltaproteobacteria bacterium]HPJ93279.1 3-phosphoserine/phosphohydroxythreonine transaminase [Deltaproteobacteria bacterium]HPR51602.1 3-phosphoserine/phosphohydroxythreonine transaminase [Deltaproteobacteria bacterium]
MRNVFIFNPGPAVLPEPVLESTSKAALNFANTGMSIMEVSHRSKEFDALANETISLLRDIMGIPENYKVLFLQGGASLQFAMVPMNLLGPDEVADYIDTGSWSSNAIKEAKKIGKVNIAASSKDDSYTRIPTPEEITFTPGAAYCHITSNNTIYGSQWQTFPDTKDVPLVADMSSDILSRKIDVSKFGIIYAGAQKNMGPAGVTAVIIRDDLADKAPENTPTMLKYSTHVSKNSMHNTCPVTAIFVVHEVLKWIIDQGGVSEIEKINVKKAALIYDILDASKFYRGTVEKASRSKMNIPFRLPSEDLEKEFLAEAGSKGLVGLKGHRSVGGIRASMYNALPMEGAQRLADFMVEFEKSKS